MKKVYVSINQTGRVTHIFKTRKEASGSMDSFLIASIPESQAVSDIRKQVLERQHGRCLRCDCLISWETMHMDERIPKGAGGSVSLENCQGLCAACHIGPGGKHSDRNPRFRKSPLTDENPCAKLHG